MIDPRYWPPNDSDFKTLEFQLISKFVYLCVCPNAISRCEQMNFDQNIKFYLSWRLLVTVSHP